MPGLFIGLYWPQGDARDEALLYNFPHREMSEISEAHIPGALSRLPWAVMF